MLDIEARPFDNEYDPCHRYCYAWVATAIIGSAVVGGVATAYSASKASEAQQKATKTAADTTLNMYNTTRGDLAPYRQMGQDASAELSARLPFLTSPISFTKEDIENSPGWKVADYMGQKAVTNSAAARGLGSSGAALKGAATFARDLADQTYQSQFNMENTNRTNAFNRLQSLIGIGAGAAAGGGAIGQDAAKTAASAQIAGGNAQAAGYNAMGTAVKNSADSIAGYGLYKGLYGDRGSSGSGIGGSIPA